MAIVRQAIRVMLMVLCRSAAVSFDEAYAFLRLFEVVHAYGLTSTRAVRFLLPSAMYRAEFIWPRGEIGCTVAS